MNGSAHPVPAQGRAEVERPILFSGPMVRALLDGRKIMTRRVMKPQPIPSDGPFFEYSDPALRGVWTNEPRWDNRDLFWVEGDNEHRWRRCPYGQPGDRLWVRETWTADVGHKLAGYTGAWWHEVPKSLRTRRSAEMLYYRADDSRYHAPSDEVWALQSADELGPEVRRSEWEPSQEDWEGVRWQPSIFMPRWASRITLEITNVRVERLQDISPQDALAEGCGEIGDHLPAFPEKYEEWSEVERERWRAGEARATYIARCADADNAIAAFSQLWDSINAGRGYSFESNPWVWAISFQPITPEISHV